MREFLLGIAVLLFGTTLAISQNTSTQQPPDTERQAVPQAAPQSQPDMSQPQQEPRMGNGQPNETRETPLANQPQTTGRSTRAGVPWLWAVVGLGVVVLLLIFALGSRGSSSNVERVERIERHEDHHDDLRRAG